MYQSQQVAVIDLLSRVYRFCEEPPPAASEMGEGDCQDHARGF